MTRKILSLVTAAALLCLAACDSMQSAAGGGASFNVTPTSLSFGADGGQATVAFTAPEAWAAKVPAEWVTIQGEATGGPGAGTLTLVASANTTTDPRAATLSITSGAAIRTVSILQEAGKGSGGHTDDPASESNFGGQVNDWSDSSDPNFEKE
ncbi:MAG: BACON domain-containing protein [Bacteroidales bacterium]|nr:BACON domain-containing protein [Bacteroidales bacterium]